jgi:hypothetical protein
VNPCEAFDRTNRIAFQEHAKALDERVLREATPIHRRALVSEESLARFAAIAMRTVAVGSTAPHWGTADRAFHDEPPSFVVAVR